MSYILDALKKSEKERPPGPVPDLFTVHGPQPSLPRRPKRAIVAAVLFLIVLAISLWAWIGTGRRDEGAGQSPVASAPQPGVVSPVAPEIPSPAAAPAPTAPVRAAATAVAPSWGIDDRSRASAPSALKSRAAIIPPVVQSTAPPVVPSATPPAVPAAPPVAVVPAPAAAPAVPPVQPPAPVAPAPAVTLPTTPATPTTPAGGAGVSAPGQAGEMPPIGIPAASTVVLPEPPPALAEEPPADGRVLDLAELPATIRAELPKLLVSGHVWSEEPSLRLLSVDDRLLRQGGEAAPGVSLQEITPAGAVFVYKGWHFRVAGGRP